MKTKLLGALALGLAVAACGTQPQERTTGGAAAGAATGAGIGALGGPPGVLAGAAIGAGVGAATGAVTEPSTLNLGEPPWSNPQARVPGFETADASGSSMRRDPQVRDLQRTLNARGYDAGPVDGIYGPRTRQAVMSWQRANNMEATGRPNQQMMSQLGVSGGRSGTSTAQSDRDRAYMGGGMVGTGQTGGTQGSMGGGTSGSMNTQGSTGGSGALGNSGGMGNRPMGNTDAQGPAGTGSPSQSQNTGAARGTPGTLGGGAGAPSVSSSPSNPGTGSNSAGSSSGN